MPYDPKSDDDLVPEGVLADGAPGMPPRWTSSAKSGVGTALDARSRVWFTMSHGIVDEVYYPRVDQANTRDLGLLVSGPHGYFAEEKRDAASVVALLAPGVPGYRVTNTARDGRWRITKTIITHPEHDVLLQRVHFEVLDGTHGYRVFALFAPHVDNQGWENDGWVGEYKGMPALFAQRRGTTLALASSAAWRDATAGYVGTSDGWQDVHTHGHLTSGATFALNGNVALCGEITLPDDGAFVLALGFGRSANEAGQRARIALNDDFDRVAEQYVRGWTAFHARGLALTSPHAPADAATSIVSTVPPMRDLYRVSAAVLATHEDRSAPGGLIASLSIPWGQAKGDHDLGGYHLVWPRDLVECAGGLLAAGHHETARRTLRFLMGTQEADGHWAQNMWLDGTPYWVGIQMDETAFPILLADLAHRIDALDGIDPWPMVRAAATYLLRNGPVTQQDRWEEDAGYAPFTLAVEIAALLAAADLADHEGESDAAALLRDAADAWNESVERWTYVTGTALAKQVGVDGYYARIAPPDVADAASPAAGWVPIKNRTDPGHRARYDALVSPDALALVRFGLRDARDPRILDTIRVIDATLRVETPTGPVWDRYNEDGYGEHDDGSPFDGAGTGRGWPLFAGERGHWAIAAGDADEARRMLGVMGAQSSDGGLIPEQVWDAADIPERELYCGRPAGSAMPLAWAHAEYVKLVRSIHDGAVFDLPPQPAIRYRGAHPPAPVALWTPNHIERIIRAGQRLRILVDEPVIVRWTTNDWQTDHETTSYPAGLDLHAADLDTSALPSGTVVRFTYRHDADRWAGTNWTLTIVARPAAERSAPR